MARFYASIQGTSGEASRTGTARSGISGHIRGWNIGACVSMEDEDGKDVCIITITGGSSGRVPSLPVGRFIVRDGEIVKLP